MVESSQFIIFFLAGTAFGVVLGLIAHQRCVKTCLRSHDK